jgi:hypothetical protein
MATLMARRRVFDSVFPPGESPFLSGIVANEHLPPDQQKLRDVVTRCLRLSQEGILDEAAIAQGTLPAHFI